MAIEYKLCGKCNNPIDKRTMQCPYCRKYTFDTDNSPNISTNDSNKNNTSRNPSQNNQAEKQTVTKGCGTFGTLIFISIMIGFLIGIFNIFIYLFKAIFEN